jgi:hypothetical protein
LVDFVCASLKRPLRSRFPPNLDGGRCECAASRAGVQEANFIEGRKVEQAGHESRDPARRQKLPQRRFPISVMPIVVRGSSLVVWPLLNGDRRVRRITSRGKIGQYGESSHDPIRRAQFPGFPKSHRFSRRAEFRGRSFDIEARAKAYGGESAQARVIPGVVGREYAPFSMIEKKNKQKTRRTSDYPRLSVGLPLAVGS